MPELAIAWPQVIPIAQAPGTQKPPWKGGPGRNGQESQQDQGPAAALAKGTPKPPQKLPLEPLAVGRSCGPVL